jgi:1,4-dihydroxy-2-naphthoate octaprenyltransferase
VQPISKSTLLHLRIPFSFYLLPVFLFASAWASPTIDLTKWLLALVSIHLFLYPASNGYNSYFDKDEESIGGLENPPEVSSDLYWVSLLFDVVAIILGAFVSSIFALMLLIYGLISKAYSHPLIRLKKYPAVGVLTVAFFQGFFTFWMSFLAISGHSGLSLRESDLWQPAILSTIMLLGSYPMTQIYQHQEDARRGDRTLSLKLGVKGTFLFTLVSFTVATALYIFVIDRKFGLLASLLYPTMLTPVVAYFLWWFYKATKVKAIVDFKHTMRLNKISALCLNLYFLVLWLFF